MKHNQGLSGLAFRHGIAIAIPSGMLCIMIPTVTVKPNRSDSRADAATASPSGKLCSKRLKKRSMATLLALRASGDLRSEPVVKLLMNDMHDDLSDAGRLNIPLPFPGDAGGEFSCS
mmetsp:Transcript_15753/g.34019  ORF Transcript_15753/g.34019 Transcript_15753/m.34019 type:complete len:117 (-) Transcript_15753:781-1131(-)